MNTIKSIITSILVWEAKLVLKKFKPKVVGITGSVGKSSAKEAIAFVLGSKFDTRRNQKSCNNELGMALAILGLNTVGWSATGWALNIIAGFKELRNKKFPEILVLEMGVDRPRDLDRLLRMVRPDIAVVTALGEIPVHVEFFSGPEEVAREKAKLIKNLSTKGTAILNFDDDVVWDMKKYTSADVIDFGFGKGAEVFASNFKNALDGIYFKVDLDGASVPVKLNNAFGKQNVYAALTAIAVGRAFDLNLIDMVDALSRYTSLPGRLRLIDGVKGSFILDDSYNASPIATHAALDALEELPVDRRIVIFGDMLEIGKYTVAAHKSVGQKVSKFVDYFVTVGPRSKFAANEAIAFGMSKDKVLSFSTSKEASLKIVELINEGDWILVKGSQAMRMERIVEEIMAHPDDASQLLVRQDKFWKDRE